MAGAPRKVLTIPLVAGLQTKGDRRAQDAPALDIATDVEFDDIGGLRLRYPFAAMSNAILGGGTLANCRKLAVYNDELLCFTVDTLYSWNAQLSVWVPKGTHLAATVDEQTVFQGTGDQYDCDRAELNGVVVYAWTNKGIGVTVGAIDKVTGEVLLAPYKLVGTISGFIQVRLVALQTRILLFAHQVGIGTLQPSVIAIDPANVATSVAATATTLITAQSNSYLDATQIIGSDAAVVVCTHGTTSAYSIFTVTAGLTVASASKARTCDQGIAVACTPDGLHAQVIRTSTTNVLGDLILLSSLADVFTGQSIATSADPGCTIACAHGSVKVSGQYRCYVFWSSSGVPHSTYTNWVDDGNNLGTKTLFAYYIAIASRAFDYNGTVYVHGVFAELNETGTNAFQSALQNTYFLFRQDGFLLAKMAPGSCGGFSGATVTPGIAQLPGVQATGAGVFSWCGNIRRIIELGSSFSQGYAQRAPRDITVTFDDSAARRCIQIGNTAYIPGGQLLQYDSVQLAEVGFHIMPWAFVASTSGTSGNLSAGGYAYKGTYRWDNAAGELDRSSTSNIGQLTAAATATLSVVGFGTLTPTRKTSPVVACEMWRTVVNPAPGSPFYLETSKDPTDSTNPNRYLANNPTVSVASTLTDGLSDAALSVLENNPENGAVLPNIAPPAARVIFSDDTRIYLADIAGLPNTVWYSQQRNDGQVAQFNDALTFNVPADGGPIRAIGNLDGAQIVWRESATYAFSGGGFDNTGVGANFTLARVLSRDLGAIAQEAIAFYDDGFLVKTSKGWFLLDRGLNYTYVGAGVAAYDAEAVLAVVVMPSRHQVRIQTTARTLMFDTLVKQWATWSVVGIDATLWNGQHVVLTPTGTLLEQSTYAAVNYGFDVETSWIKPNDQQGRIIVDYFGVLGELRSAFSLRVRMAGDYIGDGAGGWQYHTDSFWDPFPGVVGSSLQVRPGPAAGYSRCEALKVRLTAYAPDHVSAPTGPCARLTSIALQYADEPGLFTGLNQAQKV